MGSLDGRVALVTGGSRGLGRAVALELGSAGAAVAVGARSEDDVKSVADEIGGKALGVRLDVADADEVEEVVRRVENELGPVDILVNNAGVVWPLGKFLTTDQQDWEKSLDINLFGVVRCIRAVLPGMLERGYGRIVNVSSGAAKAPGMPSAAAYSAGKAAVDVVTANLAKEFEHEHEGADVRITGIRPGVVDTSMQDYMRSFPREQVGDAFYDKFHGLHEEGQLSSPDDAARLVRALIESDRNGETLDVREDEAQELLESL